MATKNKALEIDYAVYPDWWSFIHFSFGVFLTMPLILMEFSFFSSFFIMLFLLSFYEFIEPQFWPSVMGHPYREKPSNAITDIIFGMIGFFAAWHIINWKLNLLLAVVGIAIFWIADILTTRKYVKLVSGYIKEIIKSFP